MSKTVGIVGGIGPESTIEYYRQIVAEYRKQSSDGNYPSIIINSINLQRMINLITAAEFPAVTEYLLDAIEKLARAGADFAVIAANTPHIVFDELRERSVLPLISIVEATCAEAQSRALQRVCLFGTRFTMQGSFYQKVFAQADIELIVPDEAEQDFIHEHYMSELVNGIFLPETRARLLSIVDQLSDRHQIEAVILGGTELPLILRDAEHNGIPFLDTTAIHVSQIVAELTA